MRAGSRRRVFGAEALDFVEINVGVLSARRGQAGDPNRHLIKIRISPHPVKEVTCLGQEVDEKPRTEQSRLFDPPIVSPVH